ncbi:XapX domain-containing protein [Halanaerobaculum tunisiense]
MNQVLLSTLSGLLVGGLFSLLNLPIPAPPSISGVMGIVGIYLGFVMANALV